MHETKLFSSKKSKWEPQIREQFEEKVTEGLNKAKESKIKNLNTICMMPICSEIHSKSQYFQNTKIQRGTTNCSLKLD